MKTLPKRVFNSPLIEYANFEDGSHVNLIRITPAYKDGAAYAIDETSTNPFCRGGLHKSYEDAKRKFNLMVRDAQHSSKIISQGVTGN